MNTRDEARAVCDAADELKTTFGRVKVILQGMLTKIDAAQQNELAAIAVGGEVLGKMGNAACKRIVIDLAKDYLYMGTLAMVVNSLLVKKASIVMLAASMAPEDVKKMFINESGIDEHIEDAPALSVSGQSN